MTTVAIIGLQWGDEGKGKIVDYVSQDMDVVIRATGGNNTGRTIVNEYGEIALHLVPAGIFNPRAICVIGNGVVVDPKSLFAEISDIEKLGTQVLPQLLKISSRAHLVMPWHIMLDRVQELQRGKDKIGTTLRGIGPCFTDKVARTGFRVGDIFDLRTFKDRFFQIFQEKSRLLSSVYNYKPDKNVSQSWEEFSFYIKELIPFVENTHELIWKLMKEDKRILLEGSQGTLLDPDWGIDYPFVTSSPVTVAGLSQGSGIPGNKITKITGVVKAYSTRVAAGPFPTEMPKDIADFIREKGKEYGATTGRARRCGWLDIPLLNYAIAINGVNSLALTKADVLGYLYNNIYVGESRANNDLSGNSPTKYKLFNKAWGPDIGDCKKWEDLPSGLQEFIVYLENRTGVPVEFISLGKERGKMIVRSL